MTASGGTLTGLYNDGNHAAYTGGITLNGGTLNLDASGSATNAYDLYLGAMTVATSTTITRLYTDIRTGQYYDGRRHVYLNGAISGSGRTLTLNGVAIWLQSAGLMAAGNLNVSNEMWFENRSTNSSPLGPSTRAA